MSKRSTILVIAWAGLMTATVVGAQNYQDALEEDRRESPHERELQELSGDIRREALEEDRRESPHERELQELSEDPRREALEEDRRELPD